MTKDLPSPELLRKLLRYEPETGKLFWRHRDISLFNVTPVKAKRACSIWNVRFAEKEAFTALNNSGYKNGSIFKIGLLAHRVIWAMVNNAWPKDQIDHIDGNRTNNKIENLRQANAKINSRNKKLSVLNTTGVNGVGYCKRDKAYVATILSKRIGNFKKLEDAVLARKLAEANLGFTERHGL